MDGLNYSNMAKRGLRQYDDQKEWMAKSIHCAEPNYWIGQEQAKNRFNNIFCLSVTVATRQLRLFASC